MYVNLSSGFCAKKLCQNNKLVVAVKVLARLLNPAHALHVGISYFHLVCVHICLLYISRNIEPITFIFWWRPSL